MKDIPYSIFHALRLLEIENFDIEKRILFTLYSILSIDDEKPNSIGLILKVEYGKVGKELYAETEILSSHYLYCDRSFWDLLQGIEDIKMATDLENFNKRINNLLAG